MSRPLWRPPMKYWSASLLFGATKRPSKTMIAFSQLLREVISSIISLILNIELEYCFGGHLVIYVNISIWCS